MNKNIKILISSIVVGLGYIFLYNLFEPQCEGFGCVANGLGYAFIGIVLIPIIFGILGSVLSSENKIKQWFISFGISFVVMLALMLASGVLMNTEKSNNSNYKNTEIPVNSPIRKTQ